VTSGGHTPRNNSDILYGIVSFEGCERMLVTCTGILVVDIIAADLPKVSEPGELTFARRGIEMHLGGHAGNVSIDLRRLGLREGEVSSVGAVGEDPFGAFIEGVLGEHGVVTRLQRVRGVGTSKDLVLVVRGEDRRFHVDIGANRRLSPEHVRSVLAEERPLIFYVGGLGHMGAFDEGIAETLREARRLGSVTFVDPVTPHGHGWEPVTAALRWADIFHCNDAEAADITGEEEPEDATAALTRAGAKLAVVSRGERGLIARTGGVTLRMPAFKVPIVDPTGAGDAFCAGVVRGLIHSTRERRPELSSLPTENLARILLEGEAAGAACVTAVGTTTAVTRENVDRLLREQGSAILDRVVRVSTGERK